MSPVECRANPGNDRAKEVPLWECPCRECWALECATYDDPEMGKPPTYAEWLAGFALGEVTVP